MGDALEVLHRVRKQLKRKARLDYASAEQERATQQAAVDAVQESIERSRHHEDPDVATWLSEEYSHRQSLERRLQRENQRLTKKVGVADERQQELKVANQREQVLEELLEKRRLERRRISQKKQAKQADDAAAVRWRREDD